MQSLNQDQPMETAAPVEVEGLYIDRPIVFIGMMGAGKSVIGRLLADRLHIPFIDADTEIEAAANMTIAEIFETHGEEYFRDGERRVIERLLHAGPCILATGGGAFMDPKTRDLIARQGISVWLKASFEVLWERVSRKSHRPLLQKPDARGILKNLIAERYPVYAEALITVESDHISKENMVKRVFEALKSHQEKQR